MLNKACEMISPYIKKHSPWARFKLGLFRKELPALIPTSLSVVCHGQKIDGLAALLESGVSIRYLLMSPSPRIVTLGVLYPKLEVKIFNGGEQRLTAFHFVLANNPRMMWIEGYHPAHSLRAADCEFCPPWITKTDPRYDTLMKNFEEAWESSRRL